MSVSGTHPVNLFVGGPLARRSVSFDRALYLIERDRGSAGSVMVSYVKARAEAQSFSAREGLLTRAERYIVLGPSLLFNIPAVGVWIVAILANVTALQRIMVVRAQAHANARRLIPEESK